MNISMLYRWYKKHDSSKRHQQLLTHGRHACAFEMTCCAAFISVRLTVPPPQRESQEIKVTPCKDVLSMVVNWSVSAAAGVASWAANRHFKFSKFPDMAYCLSFRIGVWALPG